MTLWLDAQLSPHLARWINAHFSPVYGSPPKVIWLTCGNTSDIALQAIFGRHLSTALNLLASGETLVEIGSP